MSKPLEGITVIDFTRLLPGPLATQWMADMGAKVIKIEDPQRGDYAKFMGIIRNKISLPYALLNLSKENVIADASDTEDYQKLVHLISKADVLIESFRPGQMKKWKLDFESVKKINPKIVYCSLTGFGQTGKKAHLAGHDINYLSLSGVLDQTGTIQSPALSNFQIADIAGGSLPALCGVLTGLFNVARGREGCYIDCSILDNLMAINPLLLSHYNNNKIPTRGFDLLTGAHPGYAIYECLDGKFMALGALEHKFWKAFCEDHQKTEWITKINDSKNWPQIKEELVNFFKLHKQQEWIEKSLENDYCLTPVLNYQQAFESAIIDQNPFIIEQTHPTEGTLKYFYFPLKFTQ